MRARRVRVEGRVQGVGFRWSTMSQAQILGVTGWVRNLPDGAVEVFCQGREGVIDAFVAWLEKGPIGATVRSATLSDAAVQPDITGFEIRG